jgi:ankyrin repeat protein
MNTVCTSQSSNVFGIKSFWDIPVFEANPSLIETDSNGNTPLHVAVYDGREEEVKTFVNKGMDVNRQNYDGQTPLYIACERGMTRMAHYLLKNGANPNIPSVDGATPVHIAAAGGFNEVINILASNGAFINSQDDAGDTPLHYAVRESQESSVDFLVAKCRADPNLRNDDAETPYQMASCLTETKIAKFLSSFGSSNGAKMEFGHEGRW